MGQAPGLGYGIPDAGAEGGLSARTPANFHAFKVSLCGKRKKVRRGKWKGHEGVIKNVFGTNAKFELAAICKTVTIPLKNLNIPKADLEFASGAARTNVGRGQTALTAPTGLKGNLMTPAYEPANQFGGWGEDN